MTWDEVFDKRKKMVELSPEAQRWFKSFAVEVEPSADAIRYRDLVRDLGYSVDVQRRTIELSPETQRMFESYAVEVEPSTDIIPKVSYTTTGVITDHNRYPNFLARYECSPTWIEKPKADIDRVAITTSIKDPYEDIANCFNNVVGADWIKCELEKSINNLRKENEIMTNETKRRDIPVDLGRYETDFDSTKCWADAIFHPEYVIVPYYKRVIFNNPATIILWKDGTKTVVKCGPNDIYDPEKGLAMCLLKKLCGNDGIMFHRTIRKMMESYEPPVEESESPTDILRRVNEKLKEMSGKND